MTDILDNLRDQWKNAGNANAQQQPDIEQIITASNRKLRKSARMHVGNAGVLIVTLIGLMAFFYWVAPFRTTLSHVGMALMMGGLAIRILIEFYSLSRSKHIDLSAAVSDANDQFLDFYSYRKRIHGPVTISILVAYSVGFYLLVPEFRLYAEPMWVFLFAASYIPAFAIFGYSIRTSIKREMKYLNDILALKKEIGD